MSFAIDLLNGLKGVRDELLAEGSELVHAVEAKIGHLEPIVATDTRNAETEAVQIVKDLVAAAERELEASNQVATPTPAPVQGTATQPVNVAVPQTPAGPDPATPADPAPADGDPTAAPAPAAGDATDSSTDGSAPAADGSSATPDPSSPAS